MSSDIQEKAVPSPAEEGITYTTFAAIMNQTGTNAPEPTVIAKSIPGDFVWQRIAPGFYVLGSLAGAFTVNKTLAMCSRGKDLNREVFIYHQNAAQIRFVSTLDGVPADDVMAGSFHLEIKVFD